MIDIKLFHINESKAAELQGGIDMNWQCKR